MCNALAVRRISLSVVMSHLLLSTATTLRMLESSVGVSTFVHIMRSTNNEFFFYICTCTCTLIIPISMCYRLLCNGVINFVFFTLVQLLVLKGVFV